MKKSHQENGTNSGERSPAMQPEGCLEGQKSLLIGIDVKPGVRR
jgi:hypothetical protein